MIVYSKNEEEHRHDLTIVFKKLHSHRFLINAKKSEFFLEEIHFLGHSVSKDGVRMDPAKVEAIKSWPDLKTVHDVGSFLGLRSYYRRFIQNVTEIALIAPQKKGVTFRWTQKEISAINLLKEKMTSDPVIVLLDLKKSFVVQCDACGSSIGAVLMHDDMLETLPASCRFCLFENMGSTLNFSSSFHPQTDGQSEEANSIGLDLLKCYVSEHKGKWEQHLPLVEYAYNNTVHSSTGKAPFKIVEGGKKVPPILHTKDNIFEADKYVQDMDEMHKKVKVALEKTQAKQKKAVDRKHRDVVVSLGDWVLLRFEKARLKKMKGKERLFPKLSMRYYRPFQVCDKINDVAYRLKLLENWKIHNAFHVSLLRPYVGDVPQDMPAEDQLEVDELNEILVPEQILSHRERKVKGKHLLSLLADFNKIWLDDACGLQGQVQYLIKWRGWPESANTWEPFENVKACADIIEEFEQSSAAKPGKRGRSKKKIGTNSKKRNLSDNEEDGSPVNLGETNVNNKPISEKSEVANDLKESDDKDSQQQIMTEVREEFTLPDSTAALKDTLQTFPMSFEKPSHSGGEETCSSLPFGGETSEGGDENKEKLPNGLHESRVQKETGTSGQQMNVPYTKSGQDHHLSYKGGMENDSNNLSSEKKAISEEPGKALGMDKCVGAKKRKQGFVRRVRQGLDSHDSDEKAGTAEDRSEDVKEPVSSLQVPGPSATDLSQPNVLQLQESKSLSLSAQAADPPLTKILKAVNYNSLSVDGRQDVTVVFKVSRADGEEIFVDNKYMKANYPVLLIEFYEKHLRYSSTNNVN
ncbi:hypothetical protein L7F22_030453 [Adiantum nelumboides]|nr:hypothetical protein [Adiantum nelumboides]